MMCSRQGEQRSAQASDIPSLDRVLRAPELLSLIQAHGIQCVTRQARACLDELRERALRGALLRDELAIAVLRERFACALRADAEKRLRPVFNLSGTVLHTNLGRALLPESAVEAVALAMRSATNLEFDLDSGRRGDRDAVIAQRLCELTGAEAATVVNNNAAAVLLMLNTLGKDRETVVSRGELVEIGGAFRIPDIMQGAGTRLVEIGTTNRTHISDYAAAVTAHTAMLMKVHCSNYQISGFTHSVDVADVANIAHRHGLPATVDLGSGTLVDLSAWGLPAEVTAKDTLAKGADLITFSGDKLLGGPQAGLIAGRKELIDRINKNPLKRALRVGKLTVAALEAVLQLYRSPERLAQSLTTLRLLTRRQDDIEQTSRRVLGAVQAWAGAQFTVDAVPLSSQIGSGAMPVETLPSYGLHLRYGGQGRAGRYLDQLQTSLRALERPVIGRISENALWLDMRCLEASDEALFCTQLRGPST